MKRLTIGLMLMARIPAVWAAVFAALVSAGCLTTNAPVSVLPDPGPLPGWITAEGDPGQADPDIRQVSIEARFIEREFAPDAEGLPSEQYATHLAAGELEAFLDELMQDHAADLLSAPIVATTAGTKAGIQVVAELPPPPGAEQDPATTNITTGVSMWVLPRLPDDGTIALDLVAEVRELRGWSEGKDSEFNVPVIETRRVDSSARLPDGHTIVFGGIISDARVEQPSRLPFLKSSKPIKRELVVVVTAERVDAPGAR